MVENINNNYNSPRIDALRAQRGPDAARLESADNGTTTRELRNASDVAKVTSDLRARFTSVARDIDRSLNKISRLQKLDQSLAGAEEIVGEVKALQQQYQPQERISTANNALRNRMGFEAFNLQSVIANATFNGEPLFEAPEALQKLLAAEDIEELGQLPEQASQEIKALRNETQDGIRRHLEELTQSQITLENIHSADESDASRDNVEHALQAFSDRALNFDTLELDRPTILQILGG